MHESQSGDLQMTWTDERVELLRKLWTDGLSASQIAAELGSVTRNAVIGKVHRLGLSGRTKTTPAVSTRPRKPRPPSHPLSPVFRTQGAAPQVTPPVTAPVAPAPQPQIQPEPVPLVEAAVLPIADVVPFVCERVTIMELRECMCRWPIGDPGRPDFRFCGARTNVGTPYCTHHASIAYQPSADRRRKTAAAATAPVLLPAQMAQAS